MAVNTNDFWSKAGPGMFDLGAGLFTRGMANKEADERLRRAQGPAYDAAMNASQTALTQAGGFDPRAHAAERFNAAQGLLAGKDAKSEADMMRMLHAKGMLGAANYNPGVEGVTPTGTAMNPHMAAFYAGRGARDAGLAYDSLGQGEKYLDNVLNRSGMLQRQAANVQNTGLQAQKTQPSRAAGMSELLKGAGGLLKETGVLKDVFKTGGLFGQGMNWLGKTTGMWGGPKWDLASATDFGSWEFL